MSAPAGRPGGSGPAAPGPAQVTAVAYAIRRILADTTGRAEMLSLPAGAALFGDEVALDSLTGTVLLREIEDQFGVDVAGEDLNLDCLATLGTLATFVAERALGTGVTEAPSPARRPPV